MLNRDVMKRPLSPASKVGGPEDTQNNAVGLDSSTNNPGIWNGRIKLEGYRKPSIL